MYLLDTNVISETRKPKPHGGVLAWLGSIPEDRIFLSAIVLAEIQAGIERLRTRDPGRAALLEVWLDALPQSYRVLALDGPVCREWARLMVGRSATLGGDAFVAATARVNELTVVTRNVRDFADFQVSLLDPFSEWTL